MERGLAGGGLGGSRKAARCGEVCSCAGSPRFYAQAPMKMTRLFQTLTVAAAFASMALAGCAATGSKKDCSSCANNKDGVCAVTGKPCTSCCPGTQCAPKKP